MTRVFPTSTGRPPCLRARVAYLAADALIGVHALLCGVEYLVLVAQNGANALGDAIETARDRARRSEGYR